MTRIATLCLASCTGCHMALVDLGQDFVDLLPALTFSPVLTDYKEVGAVDLVLVEGGVRNEEDADLLRQARAKAGMLVALGTCATFGGVPGLGDAHTREALMTEAYGRERLAAGAVPALRPRLLPVDSYVDVDYYLPGCPPQLDHLRQVLHALLTGAPPPRIATPVCSECRRKAHAEHLADLVRPFMRQALPDRCLLVQGMVCLGSVTRGGCGAACPKANVPCSGCRGATDHILLESRHGAYRDIVYRISHLLGLPVKEVEKKLADLPHMLYSYSLASPAMRRKDAEQVAEIVYRIKDEEESRP